MTEVEIAIPDVGWGYKVKNIKAFIRIYLLLKHLSLDRDKDHRFESMLMGIDTSQKRTKNNNLSFCYIV